VTAAGCRTSRPVSCWRRASARSRPTRDRQGAPEPRRRIRSFCDGDSTRCRVLGPRLSGRRTCEQRTRRHEPRRSGARARDAAGRARARHQARGDRLFHAGPRSRRALELSDSAKSQRPGSRGRSRTRAGGSAAATPDRERLREHVLPNEGDRAARVRPLSHQPGAAQHDRLRARREVAQPDSRGAAVARHEARQAEC
jgi:hypothetical protein